MKRKNGIKLLLGALLLSCCLYYVSGTANADEIRPVEQLPEPSQEELERQREMIASYNEEEARIREQYLNSEEDIQYYAYLDMSTAEEEIKPVILIARNTIIHRQSWVADGLNGQILDRGGNVKRNLPEFSELFPADWELPVSLANQVDLSYYTDPDE